MPYLPTQGEPEIATFLLSRTLGTVGVIFLALTAVFGMTYLSGDPTLLLTPLDASPEVIAQFRTSHGLDKPLHIQYVRFISGAIQGDFGDSLRQTGASAMSLVLRSVPNSLLLTTIAILLSLVIAVPLGILSAVHRNSWFDRMSVMASVFFQSVPNFWLALLLILFFSVHLRWLPTGGFGTPEHLILPAITLAAYTAARIMRLTRNSVLEVLTADFVRTARSKGLGETALLWKHVFRNAAVPVITITAIQFGVLFGGAVITETIFSWPGLGRLIVQSIGFRDFPVVLAGVFAIAFMFAVVNLVADMLYALADPQIRLG